MASEGRAYILLLDSILSTGIAEYNSERGSFSISLFARIDITKPQSLAAAVYLAVTHIESPAGSPSITIEMIVSQLCEDGPIYDDVPHRIRREVLSIRNAIRPDIAIFGTHGIRTLGHWGDRAKKLFYEKYGFQFSYWRFGFADLITFTFSEAFKIKTGQTLLRKLIEFSIDNPGKEISIVAHSFGTLALCKALTLARELNIPLKISSIVLNGSIVPCDFNWSHFRANAPLNQGSSIEIGRVLNLCGDRDVLPILAGRLVKGTGMSGALFFNEDSPFVTNLRLKDTGHSGMLEDEVIIQIWTPFISSGAITNASAPLSNLANRVFYYTNYKVMVFVSALAVAFWHFAPKAFIFTSRFISSLC